MSRNQNWLADYLGVSQQRVSELMKDPEWRWAKKNWSDKDAMGIRRWLNKRRSENNATADDVTDEAASDVLGSLKKDPVKVAKLRKLIEETALIKLNRGLKEGNYVLKADVEEERIGRIEAVKLKMQQIPLRAKEFLALFHGAMVATIGAPDIVKKLGEGQDMALIKAVETGLESRIEAMLMQCMKEICNSYARGE